MCPAHTLSTAPLFVVHSTAPPTITLSRAAYEALFQPMRNPSRCPANVPAGRCHHPQDLPRLVSQPQTGPPTHPHTRDRQAAAQLAPRLESLVYVCAPGALPNLCQHTLQHATDCPKQHGQWLCTQPRTNANADTTQQVRVHNIDAGRHAAQDEAAATNTGQKAQHALLAAINPPWQAAPDRSCAAAKNHTQSRPPHSHAAGYTTSASRARQGPASKHAALIIQVHPPMHKMLRTHSVMPCVRSNNSAVPREES